MLPIKDISGHPTDDELCGLITMSQSRIQSIGNHLQRCKRCFDRFVEYCNESDIKGGGDEVRHLEDKNRAEAEEIRADNVQERFVDRARKSLSKIKNEDES